MTPSTKKKREAEAANATLQVTGAVGWRKEGLRYKKNEVFLDVIETVSMLMSTQARSNASEEGQGGSQQVRSKHSSQGAGGGEGHAGWKRRARRSGRRCASCGRAVVRRRALKGPPLQDAFPGIDAPPFLLCCACCAVCRAACCGATCRGGW